ncbi:MAG TPA: XRE family transcriptional regulator [Candidatus Nanopelagicaceae bacterium]|nr:XRE family transcriptional regulator [Candidatus Nanopelagicaceae bacterium]
MTLTGAATSDSDNNELGNRIRQLRITKGISGRELAARAGVTAAYISRLENAKVSPTVATLGRVAHAMDATITDLFVGELQIGPIVRSGERRPVHSKGVDDYRITPSWTSRLEVLESIVQPGHGSGPNLHTHSGDEECVLVLEGELTIWLGKDEHHLKSGDSATFLCRWPHRWLNPHDHLSRVLWIISPAVY